MTRVTYEESHWRDRAHAAEAEAKDWQAKYADADMARFQAEALARELAEALRALCAVVGLEANAALARYDARTKDQTLAGIDVANLYRPVRRRT